MAAAVAVALTGDGDYLRLLLLSFTSRWEAPRPYPAPLAGRDPLTIESKLWLSWLSLSLETLREELSPDASVWFLPEPKSAEPTGTTASLTF